MESLKNPSIFTDKLYDHSFDIDDILGALCARTPSYLHTDSGVVLAQGVVGHHCFIIEPLPASFIAELQNHAKLNLLNADDKAEVLAFLATAKLPDFPAFFDHNFAGGWLRERVKDVALEWLDLNGLIPPSMRHVRDSSAFNTIPDKPKVKIT